MLEALLYCGLMVLPFGLLYGFVRYKQNQLLKELEEQFPKQYEPWFKN